MAPYRDLDHLTACSLIELLLGGDWACGENQTATLACVARALAPRVRPPEAAALLEVARLCDEDMEEATALWLSATAPLRIRSRRPGPRHGDLPPPG